MKGLPSNQIISKLIKRLGTSGALSVFAQERAKFEGWLKVELVDMLDGANPEQSLGKNTAGNEQKVDIEYRDWAIELKTVNTNYRHENVEGKTRPITENVKGVIKDIKKLRRQNIYKHGAVLFVVFPAEPDNKNWQKHRAKIEENLKDKELKETPFKFKNGIPGIIYFGVVK